MFMTLIIKAAVTDGIRAPKESFFKNKYSRYG
jgi:hypothetical protein